MSYLTYNGKYMQIGGAYQTYSQPAQLPTDLDGNTYTPIVIGTQTWLLENLKTTKYNTGESIPNLTDNTAWANDTTGAFCYHSNNIANKSVYGCLYNYYAISTGLLKITGYHIPTQAEWTTLFNYLGGRGVAGLHLKEMGTAHWYQQSAGTDNSSLFTALGGGNRPYTGIFIDDRTFSAYFWTSTIYSSTNSVEYDISYSSGSVETQNYDNNCGFSIRLIKDL